jgi:hypothetical protein
MSDLICLDKNSINPYNKNSMNYNPHNNSFLVADWPGPILLSFRSKPAVVCRVVCCWHQPSPEPGLCAGYIVSRKHNVFIYFILPFFK